MIRMNPRMFFVFILFLFKPVKSNTWNDLFSTILDHLFETIGESIKSSGKTGVGFPICFTGYYPAVI